MNSTLLFSFKHLIAITMLFFLSSSFAQPYAIGHTTITFTDASRGNRSVATEIYYPAEVTGDNVPTANGAIQFPQLVFGHGFVMTWNAYEYLWELLVPQGFIMAFPKTEGSLAPSHLEFARDLAFVKNEINNLGFSSTSIFYQRVASENAVMGHSMGGGAAFLAAQLDSSFSGIVTLAPAETNPSAIAASASVNVPALIFAGGNDCVTPPQTNQLPMYNGLSGDCKTYVSITGGSHCQMADSNFLCQFGEATCSPSPTITREQQHQLVGNFLSLWLKAQLQDDCTSGNLFNDAIQSESGIAVEKNCTLCSALSLTNAVAPNAELIFPNPFSGTLNINTTSDNSKQLLIYDSYARLMISQEFKRELTIDTSQLASGIYFYTFSDENGAFKKGTLIRK